MTTVSAAWTPPSSAGARSPWIISAPQDLLWFHGSVVAGLLLLVFVLLPPLSDATYAPGHAAVWALLLWGVIFDGTHVFGTDARSYLAPAHDTVSRQALPRAWSWMIVVIGPLLALIDAAVLPQRPSLLGQSGWLFQHFLLVAYLWAYFHLIRQHYGFLVLYQRRLGVRERLDAVVLWAGSLYPYLRFALGPAYPKSGLPVVLPAAWLPTLRLGLDAAAALGLAAALLLCLRRFRTRAPGPLELLVAVVTGFHILVFALLDNLLTITATLTLFHNLQYHRIVWQYENGRGRTPAGGLFRYLALGLLLGAIWYGPRILGVAVAASPLARNVLLGLGWGVALHHYYVDGRIWRVRRQPQLAAALDRGGQAGQTGHAGQDAHGVSSASAPGPAAAGAAP
jgi:hypothetical protein